MPDGARVKKAAPERGYRLSDLSNLSGVSREMLKYYFRVGLLPRERSQRRKWASYSDTYVQLIRLIQQFQRQTRLTLPQIAQVFQDDRHDPKAIQLGLLSGKFDKSTESRAVTGIVAPGTTDGDEPPLELPNEVFAQLRKAGLAPHHRELTRAEERAAALVHAGMNAGLNIDFFVDARKLLDSLADMQVRAMMSVDLTATPDTVSRNLKIIETNRVVNRWIIYEKDNLIQGRLFRVYERSKKAVERLSKWIYVPSEAFIRKHGVDRELAELEAQCENPRNRARLLPALAEAMLILGRHGEAADVAFEALKSGADNLQRLALSIRTEEFRGNFDRSALLTARILELYPDHPAALSSVGADYLIQAARARATGNADEWFQKAIAIYNRLFELKPSNPRELFAQRYFRGNAHAIFPDALGRNEEVASELEAALVHLDSDEDLGFPIPSIREIHKVAIWYFLSCIREHMGDRKGADAARREVVQRDPASNFGSAAFERIDVAAKPRSVP